MPLAAHRAARAAVRDRTARYRRGRAAHEVVPCQLPRVALGLRCSRVAATPLHRPAYRTQGSLERASSTLPTDLAMRRCYLRSTGLRLPLAPTRLCNTEPIQIKLRSWRGQDRHMCLSASVPLQSGPAVSVPSPELRAPPGAWRLIVSAGVRRYTVETASWPALHCPLARRCVPAGTARALRAAHVALLQRRLSTMYSDVASTRCDRPRGSGSTMATLRPPDTIPAGAAELDGGGALNATTAYAQESREPERRAATYIRQMYSLPSSSAQQHDVPAVDQTAAVPRLCGSCFSDVGYEYRDVPNPRPRAMILNIKNRVPESYRARGHAC